LTDRLFSLRLVQAVFYENDRHWNFPFNLYPFHTLYLVEDGDGFVRTGNTLIELKAGEACLIPAFTLFSCWCDSHIKKTYVEFFLDSPSGFNVFFEQGKILTQPIPPRQLAYMKALKPGGSLKESMRFEGELLCILSLFISGDSPKPAPGLARLRPLLTEIHANLGCDLQVSGLARKHGYSPSSLSHAFKRVFQCTPKQYAQQLLVNVIKHEFLHTDKTIAQIAAEYRFCDAYYLSNFFKRHMGVSPQVYRQTIRGGNNGTRMVP
jgi:AraC family transcriptional regulator